MARGKSFPNGVVGKKVSFSDFVIANKHCQKLFMMRLESVLPKIYFCVVWENPAKYYVIFCTYLFECFFVYTVQYIIPFSHVFTHIVTIVS